MRSPSDETGYCTPHFLLLNATHDIHHAKSQKNDVLNRALYCPLEVALPIINSDSALEQEAAG